MGKPTIDDKFDYYQEYIRGLGHSLFSIYLFIYPVELRAEKVLKVEPSNFGGGVFKGVKVHRVPLAA